jgi:hypothetical protein
MTAWFQGQLMATCTKRSGVGGVVVVHVTDPVAVVVQVVAGGAGGTARMLMLTTRFAAGQTTELMGCRLSPEPVPTILARPAKTMGINSSLFHFMLRPPGLRFESEKESHAGARPWLQLI